MPSDIQGEPLSLLGPQSVDSKREAKLLVQEAAAQLGPPVTKRAESKVYVKNYTGERLFNEEPRRYKLIRSMLAEQMGVRAICRATHCDSRTVKSVERRESESIPTLRKRIAGRTARVAGIAIERLETEVKTMPLNLLAMTFGIAVDKLNNLTGDPNLRIEHTIQDNRGNIFERMSELAQTMAKTVQAKVIESEPLQLSEGT